MLDVILIAVGCAALCLPSPTPTPATGCEEQTMLIEYVLGSAVTLGLLVYLVYALLRPERF
jgi:K+-transporting ATPase KdpF subunit